MNILLIIKEPFLDRIPSLKTLVLFLASKGNKITLLTSKSERFSGLTTSHPNLSVKYVNERKAKLELPTVVKLLFATFKEHFFKSYDLIIGGDLWGNVIANSLKKVSRARHLFFVLEYPQITDGAHPVLSKPDILEHKALKNADIVVTHDKYHQKFIIDNFGIDASRICLLANSSFTPEFRSESQWLRKQFRIPSEHAVILHSGGFGKWFRCAELAHTYQNWDESIRLIFHIGRKPTTDEYFERIYNEDASRRSLYSLSPLSNEELDEMISSADVGIALYSVEHLGYRAEQMGLAAGKIGNYLKCGLPVIATRLPSLKYIEEYGCGVLVDDESQIEPAISQILSNKDSYRENAFKCYRELWHPSNYLPNILERTEKILAKDKS